MPKDQWADQQDPEKRIGVPISKVFIGVVFTGLLVACGGQTDTTAKRLDIAKVLTLRSMFGPDFDVSTSGPSTIDPKLFQPLAGSVGNADPAECQNQASGQTLPLDLKGRSAEISANGQGDFFVVAAIESSAPVPYPTIPEKCRHVTFSGNVFGSNTSGTADIVDAPKIDGGQTVGMHRTSTIAGFPHPTEFYTYDAFLGNYVVVVSASRVFAPNPPAAPVDTDRAQKLLTDAVAAIRS